MKIIPQVRAGDPLAARSALRIALAYAVAGTAWIVATDTLVFEDPNRLLLQSTGKGLLFIAVTSCLLYLLIARSVSRQLELIRSTGDELRGILEQSSTGFYVVQDGNLVYINPRFAQLLGHESVEHLLGRGFMSFIPQEEQARFAQLMKGLALPGTHQRVVLSALHADGRRVRIGADATLANYGGRPAIIGLAQDITEREELERSIAQYVARLEKAMRGSLAVTSKMVELRDPYTAGHEGRVATLCAAIGGEMGLEKERLAWLSMAGNVHDVGKIAAPVEILSKPSRLSAPEMEIVRQHAGLGYGILKDLELPGEIAQAVLQHHERLDGSGYPAGLRGDAILLEARIIGVADTVEAMAAHRPYRPALGIEMALDEVRSNRGTLYDPDAVDACLALFRSKRFSFESASASAP